MSFLATISRLLLLLLMLAGCRSGKVAFQFRPAGGGAVALAPDTSSPRQMPPHLAAPPATTAPATAAPATRPARSGLRQPAGRQPASRLRVRRHMPDGAAATAETAPATQPLRGARLVHPPRLTGKLNPQQPQSFDPGPLLLLALGALLVLLLINFPTVTLIVLGVLALVGIGILIWLTTGHWAYGAVWRAVRECSAVRQRHVAAAAQDLQPATSALLLVILGLLLAFLIVGAIGLLSTASSVGYIVFGSLLALAVLAYPLLLFYGLFHKWKKARRRQQYIKSLSR